MSNSQSLRDILQWAFDELHTLRERFGDGTHPFPIDNGLDAWKLLINCSDDKQLVALLLRPDDFLYEMFLSHWRQPVVLTKERQRSLVIGAVRGYVTTHGTDPRTVSAQSALRLLEEVSTLHPRMFSASWYRSANAEQLALFSQEWESSKRLFERSADV